MRIVFCHTGSAKYARNEHRTPPLELWRRLWAIPGTEWTSVLYGEQRAELLALPHLPPTVTDAGADLVDLADTLEMCRAADLVVTVDTALANLAGRYNLPAMVILGATPCWRWTLEGPSPWWPSLRLYRQEILGVWSDVFDRLAADLELVAGHWNRVVVGERGPVEPLGVLVGGAA